MHPEVLLPKQMTLKRRLSSDDLCRMTELDKCPRGRGRTAHIVHNVNHYSAVLALILLLYIADSINVSLTSAPLRVLISHLILLYKVQGSFLKVFTSDVIFIRCYNGKEL